MIFEDERAAVFHSGAASVVTGMKSTLPDWYRSLTTKVDGVTVLHRKVIESRLGDLATGFLSTRKTRATYEAVLIAIVGRARQFGNASYYRVGIS